MFSSLFTDILLRLCHMAFAPFHFVKADFTKEMQIFCRDLYQKITYILQTLCALLCDIMRSLFVQTLLTFYGSSLGQILKTLYEDFRFLILQRFFIVPFLQGKCKDFTEISLCAIKYLCKISQKFTRKIATFHRHFMPSESKKCT